MQCDSVVACNEPLPLVAFQWRDFVYCSKNCFERSFKQITSKEDN